MAARWKLNPHETGLRRVGAGPRGSKLFDDGKEVASVSALGGGFCGPVTGWMWVCRHAGGVKNTWNEPAATAEEAKRQAMAFYKKIKPVAAKETK
jgi:hypothetical protein